MPALRSRKRLCALIPVAVALVLGAQLPSVVADGDKGDDGWYWTKTTKPPKGFWYKIIVHNCLPQTAVTLHYAIDFSDGTPYKNEREKFEDKKNSYQSAWIPMEKGSFSLETLEFLDADGKVVLAIPYTGTDTTLPYRFELTKEVPATAVALPAQKEQGKCKIVR